VSAAGSVHPCPQSPRDTRQHALQGNQRRLGGACARERGVAALRARLGPRARRPRASLTRSYERMSFSMVRDTDLIRPYLTSASSKPSSLHCTYDGVRVNESTTGKHPADCRAHSLALPRSTGWTHAACTNSWSTLSVRACFSARRPRQPSRPSAAPHRSSSRPAAPSEGLAGLRGGGRRQSCRGASAGHWRLMSATSSRSLAMASALEARIEAHTCAAEGTHETADTQRCRLTPRPSLCSHRPPLPPPVAIRGRQDRVLAKRRAACR
jgi:hypothetical protein